MPRTLIDEEVPGGETASGVVTRGHHDNATNFAIFCRTPNNDDETRVDIDFEASFAGDEWWEIADEDINNRRIDDGKTFRFESRGARRVRVNIKNRQSSPRNIQAFAVLYHE